MQNVGRAFSFMFQGRKWAVKMLIGAVFTTFVDGFYCAYSVHADHGSPLWLLFLVLALAASPFPLGYLLELSKNTSEGRTVPLPGWDKLGDKFVRGLVYIIILIIYSLPAFLPALIPYRGAVCLATVYGLLLVTCILPHITARYARSESFQDVFRLKEMVGFIKSSFGNLVIVFLLSGVTVFLSCIVVFSVMGFGAVALLALPVLALQWGLTLGLFWASSVVLFWAGLVVFYLYGQVYREGKKPQPNLSGGEPPSQPAVS